MNGIIIWETEGGRTTGTCVCERQPVAFLVYIKCVNTELTVRQPKTVWGGGSRERDGKQSDSLEEQLN